MSNFTLRRDLSATYDEALARVPEALKSEGFGVLTEIDVAATLQQKLGVGFRRYKILGACNPALAHRGLTTEIELGVLLPCNVVVYEDDERHAVVLAVDPVKTIAALGDARLADLAATVREKLQRALAKL